MLVTLLGETLNPPKTIVAVQIKMPYKAHFFCLLSIKLNTAKKKEAMITAVNNIFIDSPVYTSRNSGVVNHSGYLKHNTAKNDNIPKKTEIYPLINPSPIFILFFILYNLQLICSTKFYDIMPI